eukprot:g11569.t1
MKTITAATNHYRLNSKINVESGAVVYVLDVLKETPAEGVGNIDGSVLGAITSTYGQTGEWEKFLATPLERAAAEGDAGLVDKLIEARADTGRALHEAGKLGHLGVVNQLLAGGASPEEVDTNGFTPLYVAARHGQVETVQLLLLKDADKNATGFTDWTPLHIAVYHGHAAVVQALLAAGVDANLRYRQGKKTLLHGAAAQGNPEVLKALLEHGADVHAKDTSGRTALHEAADFNGVRTFHSDDGPVYVRAWGNEEKKNLINRADEMRYMEVLKILIEHGADVNSTDSAGISALHVAAKFRGAEAVDMLVEAGSNIESGGEIGKPLHHAAVTSNLDAAGALLKHGAQVNSQTPSRQMTPLYFAAITAGSHGAADMVDLLLRSDADETLQDGDGRTAAGVVGDSILDYRRVAEDYERVCRLLANAPADRVWRRRGLFVLCRAYPGRVQLSHTGSRTRFDLASGDLSGAKLGRTAATGGGENGRGYTVGGERSGGEWAVVAAAVVRLEEEDIFRTIVGFL